MLSAEDYDADLPERYGWINRALSADELGDFVSSLAQRIAGFPPRSRPGQGPGQCDLTRPEAGFPTRFQSAVLSQLVQRPTKRGSRVARKAAAASRASADARTAT